jgi:hypothetical protein
MLVCQADTIIALNIPFRGRRDYVHSTDLFAALDALAGTFSPGAYPQSLVLRRQARCQVEAHFSPHPAAFGTFVLASPRHTAQGWLVERGSPITRRIAFDETVISSEAVAEPGHVFLPAPVAGYSAFEQMIVLFKMLCAQSRAGAWLFTTLELERPLRDGAALGLTRTQMVLNRLVDADLDQDGQPAGRARMVLPPIAEGFA